MKIKTRLSTLILTYQLIKISIQQNEEDNKTIQTGGPACNTQILLSFGFEGNTNPVTREHRYCPEIKSNCCTLRDEYDQMKQWNSWNKIIIETYYETYLLSLKYILGYGAEIKMIAETIISENNNQCKSEAKKIANMNLSAAPIESIFNQIWRSVEEVSRLRKGFFCFICNFAKQQDVSQFITPISFFYQDRYYFNLDFCMQLVDKTIRANNLYVNTVLPLMSNTRKILQCRGGGGGAVDLVEILDYFRIPVIDKLRIENCYFFRQNMFYFFCENYCEQFHITKPANFFDGDMAQLKEMVKLLMENKRKFFDSPNNNVLMTINTFEDALLIDNFQRAEKIRSFFQSATDVDLNKYKTDVTMFGGVNLFDGIKMAKFNVDLSVGLLKVISIGILAIFQLFLIYV